MHKIPVHRRLFHWRNARLSQPDKTMKIVRKNAKGESRELLLKEYFLNAYLIAMLKRMGEEAGRMARRPAKPEPVRVKA